MMGYRGLPARTDRSVRAGISKLVGIHFKHHPELQHKYAHKWIASDNIWLQRVAIIHQLLYKEKTDQKLMFEMILYRKDSTEFFVQKGAGWALRQYSKTKAKVVREFISKHPELSPLTKREGMKWLVKTQVQTQTQKNRRK